MDGDIERVVLESGLVVDLERLPEDFTFRSFSGDGREETVTWAELKREIIAEISRVSGRLKAKGYRRVEVGSVQWFWLRGRRKGRFIPLNTMFLARLLKK